MALTWDEDRLQWTGGPAIANVAGSVGATYTTAEQATVTEMKNRLNDLITALREASILALD